MPKAPSYPVPALEKGLDILETLAAAAVPQSLAELAQRLERSSSELFRMLNCLEQRGYLTRDALSGKYALSLKLFTLAHAHTVTEKLLRAAHGPMRELSERVRESVHLSVLDRGQLLVVAQQESPEQVRLSIEVGGLFDAPATASGRLLLSQLEPEARRAALEASVTWRRLGARERAAFDRGLEKLAAERLSTAESETIEGVRDVSVLVGDPAAGIVAALAITRLQPRAKRGGDDLLVTEMKRAAGEITRALGWEAAA